MAKTEKESIKLYVMIFGVKSMNDKDYWTTMFKAKDLDEAIKKEMAAYPERFEEVKDFYMDITEVMEYDLTTGACTQYKEPSPEVCKFDNIIWYRLIE